MQVAVGVMVRDAIVLYNDSLAQEQDSKTAGLVLDVIVRWAFEQRPDFAVMALSRVCYIS